MLGNRKQIATVVMAVLAIVACKEKDYFNKEVYEDIISSAFPVTGVDGSHDWKTVGSGAVAVAVTGDYGGDCRVSVSLDDPATTPAPTLLATGTVAPGSTFSRVFSYPTGRSVFFISLTGPDGRRLVKRVGLMGGVARCTFTAAETAVSGTVVSTAGKQGEFFGMRYCFEDNFPQDGDYDYNDVVLTVRPVIDGSTVTLGVTLDAVGTTKQMAAALRVRGVSGAELVSSVREGDFDLANGRPAASFTIIDVADHIVPDGVKHTSDLVLLLFNDAHWALSQTIESNGNVRRWYYNTVPAGGTAPSEYANVRPVTVTYRLTLNSPEAAARFVADNLDVFAVYSTGGSYVEAHTQRFKMSEIIYDYIANTADYDLPYVWALQLPSSFRYPCEGVYIGSNRNGVLSGAYRMPGHSFAEWATDRTRATDWYGYPSGSTMK